MNKYIEYSLKLLPFLMILTMIAALPSGVNFLLISTGAILLVFCLIVGIALFQRRNDDKRRNLDFNRIQKEYLKDPDNLNNYIELGYASFNIRDYDRASSIFSKIINQFPDRPAGYCGMGIIEFQKKNFDKSKQYFEKTLELDSSYDVAREKLVCITKEHNKRKNQNK